MARAKNTRKGAAPKGKRAKTISPDPNVRIKRIGDNAEVDLSEYVKAKTAAGNVSLHCNDDLAKKLAGKELDDVYKLAAKTLGVPVTTLKSRYGKLNLGMQRMNLGNRMRAA
jgi:hypothetical protein